MEKLLIINPGSTSTKIAVYEGLTRKFSENISHPLEDLKSFPTIIDQTEYRTHVITDCLERAGAPLSAMDGIIGIGGLLKSVDSGVYRVNDAMLADLRSKGITGKELQTRLDSVHITVNKNAVPNDPERPGVTSGVRIGTPAVTTRGMGEGEMREIGALICRLIDEGEAAVPAVRAQVLDLCARFPLYPDLHM